MELGVSQNLGPIWFTRSLYQCSQILRRPKILEKETKKRPLFFVKRRPKGDQILTKRISKYKIFSEDKKYIMNIHGGNVHKGCQQESQMSVGNQIIINIEEPLSNFNYSKLIFQCRICLYEISFRRLFAKRRPKGDQFWGKGLLSYQGTQKETDPFGNTAIHTFFLFITLGQELNFIRTHRKVKPSVGYFIWPLRGIIP
jgi:hypothetical protein